MLSGFLDSCKLDALFQWSPPGSIENQCGSHTPAFLRLLINLIWTEGTRIDALNLILLLLRRKTEKGSEETVSKVADALLADSSLVNRVLALLCATLNEPTSFSETTYNTLLLLSEIVTRLGCALVARWTDSKTCSTPCECTSTMLFTCPNLTTHILNLVLRLTKYPIRMISAPTNLFWLTALRSSDPSLIARLHLYCRDLLVSWRQTLKRDGAPSGSGVHSEWTRGVFGSEEYVSFFSKYRTEVLRCLSLSASKWPLDFLQALTSLTDTLLKKAIPVTELTDLGKYLPLDSPIVYDWDTLELLYEHTLSPLKEGFVSCGQTDQFDHAMSNLLRQFLQSPAMLDPTLRGKQATCASMLMQQTDPRYDAELLVPLLMLLFACFRYNPDASSTYPVRRPRCVKTMHMAVATAFFRLTRANPERIMPYFESIANEVTSLWADPNSGVVEKCVLLESLIILCFRLPHPVSVQKDLLARLLAHVTSAWCMPVSSVVNTESNPIFPIFNACTNGSPDLLTLLGLDLPLSEHEDAQLAHVQMRITLGQNVLSLLATARRISDPPTREQLDYISVPLLEPLLPSVLVVLRAFNELWLPENLARVHPTIVPAFELTEHVKFTLLSLQVGITQQQPASEEKSSLERIRSCLFEVHENLLTIVGLLFTGLAPKLYQLPADQLATILHIGCCGSFDHIPDLKLNSLLRLVVRPFIRGCPTHYLSTAVVPLVPPIVEAVVQRIDRRWAHVNMLNHAGSTDGKAVAEELVEERLTRLLGRSLIDFFRLIYTFSGCESSTPDTDQGDGDGMDDIDMQAEAKSTTSVNQGSDTRISGTLAQLLVAASRTTSLHNGDGANECMDPLFLHCLAKCLAWPDSLTCLKASQWIPTLIDLLTQQQANGVTSGLHRKSTLSAPLAEAVLFGVLCGLHVNGKNTETNLSALLSAGLKVYSAVDVSVAVDRLRTLVTKVLINASDAGPEQSDKVLQSIQTFETKLFDTNKPLTERAKREIFKKLMQPIIGIPLSQQFCDNVTITCLAPLVRSKWRQPARNGGDAFPDNFGLSELFSN
ncbi:exportin-5 [Clonorchis sinensis]|uniref:Exportin-5 n=1 Tax=Clonorchis sinensis TaxID=79923 RepID=H2KP80_CLOSI|nr:exportin-5 [Clonorchis sinensis]